MTEFKYCVYCEEEPAICFESEAEAMKFAREDTSMYNSVRVEKSEVDEDGDILNTEVLWTASGKNVPEEKEVVSNNEFETDFPESDVKDFSGSDDIDYDEIAKQYKEDPADWVDDNKLIKEAVDALEENEDEVECKVCFELGPKAEMKKLDIGYVCPKCAQELQSHQGTNLDLIDKDPFSLDYEDPRDFDEHEEIEVKEEPVDENEIRKFEAGIEENLEEHINDRPADIESDQVLQGADNAVVDCEVAKVIAHSEDEKPLDCKMEKPALEEPLADKEVDVKVNEELSEEEVKELDKEVETLKEELKVIIDFSEYKPWQGAVDTYELIRDANKLDDLEAYLEECYPEGITATQINDILWFDGDQVLSYLGLGDIEDEDEEVDESLKEEAKEVPWVVQWTEDSEPSFIGFAVNEDKLIDKLVKNGMSGSVGEMTTFDILDKEMYLEMKNDNEFDDDEVAELDKYFGITEELVEAKKDDELPVDPEAAKLEVHTMLNDLVADEIEAINGYEEAKKEILDAPISHKDAILDTVDHIEDEEKEHVDELIDATTEIPFDKEEAPVEEAKEDVPAPEGVTFDLSDGSGEPEEVAVKDGEIIDKPLDQDFPEVEENLEEKVDLPAFDSEVKVGDKIRIIHLEGEDNSYDGKEGTVDHIDSIGQLHGTWGGLAVIPGVDDFDIITEECLTEAKAKPEADKVQTYNDGLKLAKLHNKPVIYGYTNKSYDNKFFALDDPIICNSVSDETKKFKAQYKSCGTVYVAYPDRSFAESLEESMKLSEYWWEDNDPMNQVDQEEDNVECGWCGEVFAKSDCKYEQDFGYLCPQCEDALKSRGEQLVFVEPAPKE